MTKTILVIEDDEAQRYAFARILRKAGYTAVEADSGERALELLGKSPPDAVLLDWVLPGMSGWDFLRALRKDPDLGTLPVVSVSGHPETAEAGSLLSGTKLLFKPVADKELLAAVKGLLTKPRVEILVTDDDPGVAGTISLMLMHFGYAVRQVRGGQEAVDVYRRHRGTITAVLLDVQMEGLDGPQTFAKLKEVNPSVRVLFMSSNTGRYSTEDLLRLGASQVLRKPVNVKAVDEALGTAGPRG